jgi:hypothetical protein
MVSVVGITATCAISTKVERKLQKDQDLIVFITADIKQQMFMTT